MSGQTVSVVIPVRDGERHLAEAIDSVLAQSHGETEVVVVDDGSSDGSRAIAAGFGPPVRCLSQQQGGIGAARNHGVAHAGGQFLTFLDADDRWPPERLEHQLAAMRADPSLELVYGHVKQFLSPELELADAPAVPEDPQPAYLPGTLLMRRAAWDRVGEFRTDTVVSEGLDWILRARELGLPYSMLGEVVIERRLHGGNHGRAHHDSIGEYARTLKKSLDRRRAAQRRRSAGSATSGGV